MIDLVKNGSWITLLKQLSLDACGVTLPCVSKCPACDASSLVTFQDTIYNGTWHHCSACKFSGDAIELAARAWKVSCEESFKNISEIEVVGDSTLGLVYDPKNQLRREFIETTWNESSTILDSNWQLRNMFGAHDASETTWTDRGHQLVRLTTMSRLVELGLSPKTTRRSADAQVAILPLRDLPGRIVAFSVVIPINGAPVVVRSECLITNSKKIPPAIFSTEAITETKPDRPLWVVTDPVLAAHLQIRHFSTNSELLPVVACRNVSEIPDLLMQRSTEQRVMVWGERNDTITMAIAAALNANLVINRAPSKPVVNQIDGCGGAVQWLHYGKEGVRPWREVLINRLRSLPMMDIKVTLNNLKFSATDTEKITEELNEGTKKKLRADNIGTTKSTCINAVSVNETSDGWRLARTGELISDVIIRIDTVFTRPGSGEIWYRGRLIYKEEEIPFDAMGKILEKNALRFARQRLLELGKGLSRFKESWQSRAFELSLSFHQPTGVEAIDGYGWDAKRQRFLLPGFSLELGGSVKESPPLLFPGESPIGLDKPVRLTTEELRSVTMTRSRQVLWPTFAAVMYNVMAPIFCKPTLGLIVPDAPIGAATDIAIAAGCRELQIEKKLPRFESWPVAVTGKSTRRHDMNEWFDESQPKIIQLPDMTARILYINGGWLLAKPADEDRLASSDEEKIVVRKMTPDFLHFLASNRLRTGLRGDDLMTHTTEAIAAYLLDRGVDPEPVRASIRFLIHKSRFKAWCFGRLLSYLYGLGALAACVNKPRIMGKRNIPRLFLPVNKRENTIFIPFDDLNNTLDRYQLPRLKMQGLAEGLKRTGHLIEERSTGGMKGWFLPADWFERQMKRHCTMSNTRTPLKLLSEETA